MACDGRIIIVRFIFEKIRWFGLYIEEVLTIANNELLINEQITDREIRLVSETGEQLGVMPVADALRIAYEREWDLVKISPNANRPVCKLMDYGKYHFEQTKREKEAKKKQTTINVKEMRLSVTIDKRDLEIKAKNVQKMLAGGDKVKVSIRFRGRQIAHSDQGMMVMNTFTELLGDNVNIEKKAQMEGRSMFMILSPKN